MANEIPIINLVQKRFTWGVNYFTLSDIEPEVEGSTITYLNGWGEKRYWGTPHVTATVFIRTNSFVAIHMGFHHKHGGGQGYFYYVLNDGEIDRKTYAQLPGEQQYQIEQSLSVLPKWAKSPSSSDSKRLKDYKERLKKSEIRKAKLKIAKKEKEDRLQKKWEEDCQKVYDPRVLRLDFDENGKERRVKTKKNKSVSRFKLLDF